MNRIGICLLCWAAIGCGGEEPAPLAGGKPIAARIDSARSGDAKVRREAIAKLGNVGDADKEAYATVVESLHDKDSKVRCEAILALLKFGDSAREKIDELEEMSKRDPSSKVRTCAAKAVEKLKESPATTKE